MLPRTIESTHTGEPPGGADFPKDKAKVKGENQETGEPPVGADFPKDNDKAKGEKQEKGEIQEKGESPGGAGFEAEVAHPKPSFRASPRAALVSRRNMSKISRRRNNEINSS